ncbi:replication termination factor 2-like [Xenia sp. Carnegie-2017]|uniref:replication termination factor 2-like n=1 Tax=Xenia sp. Carnegie-2017 TaxID=2897299 RepID=UPI001F044D51|nr:replication termination factor 2-like [Xenia sp. Carnegie-2017]
MGCDGGTIPKRCELVREKKKPEKVDKEIELNAKWFHCAISQQELSEPIVCCELGNLYRKESVIEYLLDKSKATTDIAKHIRSLKDVKELVLTKRIRKSTKEMKGRSADTYLDFQASDYICPITGMEMNGRYRFIFSWKCGCAFSERGLKEVPSTTCHSCGTPFTKEDLIVINGGEEDIVRMKERMMARRQKAKEDKKLKKSKRENNEGMNVVPKKKSKVVVSSAEETKSKDSAMSKSSGVPATTKAPKLNDDLAYSKYKSVAANPDASKVFKSLFSSSHKEKPGQLKSNWVTYQSYHC